MSQLWPYVSTEEYACKHCGRLPHEIRDTYVPYVYEILFDSFKEIREAWGKPIKINSGYRCPEHNQSIGGELLSVHLFGLALDLDCKDVAEVHELDSLIEEMYPDLRRGTYTKKGSFIHIDIGYHIIPRMSESWIEGVRWTG